MTETVAQSGNVATATPDTMEWDSRARRMVMIYLPLACFVVVVTVHAATDIAAAEAAAASTAVR